MASLSLLSLSHHKSTPLLKPLLTTTKTPNFYLITKQNPFQPFSQTPQIHPFLAKSNPYPLHTHLSIHPQIDQISTERDPPIKFAFWVLFWASLSLAWFAASGDANSAVDSIRGSGFGVRIANKLRGLGWKDEFVVFVMAMLPVIELRGAIPVGYWLKLTPVALTVLSVLGTLPVIELRGAIPVGYWLKLSPIALTVLSVLGNMVPVPFILLYLKKLATFLAKKNQYFARMLDLLFKNAKEKAGPVEEFQWLGLMLFVAVPFPGTGAWTGAIVASILDMPFWHAMSANFFGVVLAGLLVNLLVNLGLKYAIFTGLGLFVFSTFMWSILRSVKRSLRWGEL